MTLMLFDRVLERAVQHQMYLDTQSRISTEEVKNIINRTKDDVSNKHYDFSSYDSLVLQQNNKKRRVKQYSGLYSSESILCQCIKQILDTTGRVRFINRNKALHSLFNTLPAIIQMMDFTIVKFDFHDYFNSVSTVYVFEKYIKSKLKDRFEIDLICDFAKQTKYAYAGLCTSNSIAEIVASHFDEAVSQAFKPYGLVYHRRYVDDSIVILNQNLDSSSVQNILDNVLKSIFHDPLVNVDEKCTTKYNMSKYVYITRRTLTQTMQFFDFLGYAFYLGVDVNGKVLIKYGITPEKMAKYNDRLDKLIGLFLDIDSPDYNNTELLRHRISAFTRREVYQKNHYSSVVWKVKGFISNYGELRYMLETGLVHSDTLLFLKNMVEDAFQRAGLQRPYYLCGNEPIKCGYNLFGNMKSNKTILLVEHIGYNYDSLARICQQIGISQENEGRKYTYGELVRLYLIKVKVGY